MRTSGSDVTLRTGIDNSGVPAGLNQFEAMVNARVKSVQSRLNSLQPSGGGNWGALSGNGNSTAHLARAESQFKRANSFANRFQTSLDRIGGTLSNGLGFGLALGGLAALERGFTRAIEKARQFEVAQLAIGAAIQSSYRVVGSKGNEMQGIQGYKASLVQARKLNTEIIKRQALNILTYEEQLNAFQSSINAGARKGLSTKQTLDVSENIAIAAKTLGLRGEQIANASRLALGGGVNVGRSTIGRTLGISNEDIAGRSGTKLVDFLMEKTKGFSAGQPSFAKSVEAIVSTLESKLDVFFAKVGQKMFKNIGPQIDKLGDLLDSQSIDQFADTLSSVFTSLFKGLETIATSPAIPLITHFLEFLASYGDKLLIVGALGKLAGVLTGLRGNVASFVTGLEQMAMQAATTEGALNGLGGGAGRMGAGMAGGSATARAIASRGPLGATAAAGGLTAFERQLVAQQKRLGYVRQAQNEIGAFPGLPHISGRNLSRAEAAAMPGMEGFLMAREYDKANLAHKKSILARAKTIQSEEYQLRKEEVLERRRARQLGGGVNSTAHLDWAAGADNRAAQARVASTQKWGRYGVLAADNLGKAMNWGAMGYMGSMAVDALTQGRGTAVEGAGNALEGTLVGGSIVAGLSNGVKFGGKGALAGKGITGPLISLIAGLSIGSAFQEATVGKDEEAQKLSESALEKAYDDNPHLKEIAEKRSKLSNIESIFGKNSPQAQKVQKELADAKEIGRATFIANTQIKDFDSLIQKYQQNVAGYQMGYGNGRVILKNQSGVTDTQIKKAAAEGKLPVDADISRRAKDDYLWKERDKALFKLHNPDKALPDSLAQFNTVESVEQDLQAKRLIEQNKLRLTDQLSSRKLSTSSAKAGLLGTSKGDLQAQLAGLESSLLSQRENLDMSGTEFTAFVNKAKAKLVKDFNEPLREAQARLEGLNLGGAPGSVAEKAKLLLDVTLDQIQKLGDAFGWTKEQISKLQMGARARSAAQFVSAKYSDLGTVAGATGRPDIASQFQLQSKLATESVSLDPATLKAMGYTTFDAYRRASVEQLNKEQQLEKLNGGGLSTGQLIQRAIRERKQDIKDADRTIDTAQRDERRAGEDAPLAAQERNLSLTSRNLRNAGQSLDAFTENVSRSSRDRGFAISDRNIGQDLEQNAFERSRLSKRYRDSMVDAGLNQQGAEIGYQRALIAPSLKVGGAFQGIASAIQSKVDAEDSFDPGRFESAYRQSKKLDRQSDQLSIQNAKLARDRSIDAVPEAERAYVMSLRDLAQQNTALLQARLDLQTERGVAGAKDQLFDAGRALDMQKQGLGDTSDDLQYSRGIEDRSLSRDDRVRAIEEAARKKKEASEALVRGGAFSGAVPRVASEEAARRGQQAIQGNNNIVQNINLTIETNVVSGANANDISSALEAKLATAVPRIMREICRDSNRRPS